MILLCQVYKGSRQEEMYLYVDRAKGLDDVPESLLARLGELQEVMLLPLEPGRKLARADVVQVIDSINTQGYYLQMPPTPAELHARERADD